MGTVVVTRNYQITLSKDLREELNIKMGERMKSRIEDNKIIIEKIKENPIENSFGIWKTKKSGVELVNEMRKSWRE